MNHRLNLDVKDPNYIFVERAYLKLWNSRKSQEILAANGFRNIKKHIFSYKIMFY